MSSVRAVAWRRAVLGALAVGLLVLPATAPARAAALLEVPASIPSDCSVDVTGPLLTWISSVPDNSTLSFASSGCYRIEGTLELANRRGLTIDGNGATFRATTVGDGHRPQWRLVDGSNLVLRDMKIDGGNPQPGTHVYSLQWSHGVDLQGPAGIELDHLDITDVYGDCVYVGRGWDSHTWSSSVRVHDSTCSGTGRMGVAVTAARDVLVERTTLSGIAMTAFDVEPNGSGYGATGVTFTSNTVSSKEVLDVTGDGPVDSVTLSNNTLRGLGSHIAVIPPAGQRRSNIAITGNTNDTAFANPGSVAIDIYRVDGATVTNNVMPLGAPNMALVYGTESCNFTVAGNSYPGGVAEARIDPYDCGASAPTLSSFAPANGPVGTTVTITGNNLTGAATVAFNGIAAAFAVVSSTEISAVVPVGASTGPIQVTIPSGTATTPGSFTVTAPPPAQFPAITSLSPTAGPVGTSVTITGTNLTGATRVTFNSVAASFAVSSGTRITTKVPKGATTGVVAVVAPDGTATSPTLFTVTVKSRQRRP